MLTVGYFISALIVVNLTPPKSWVFNVSYGFSTKDTCEEHLKTNRDALLLGLGKAFSKILINVEDYGCYTQQEILDMNKALGHVYPDDVLKNKNKKGRSASLSTKKVE